MEPKNIHLLKLYESFHQSYKQEDDTSTCIYRIARQLGQICGGNSQNALLVCEDTAQSLLRCAHSTFALWWFPSAVYVHAQCLLLRAEFYLPQQLLLFCKEAPEH